MCVCVSVCLSLCVCLCACVCVFLLYVAVKVRLTGGEPTTRGDFAQIMQDGVGGIDCRVWCSLLGLLFSGSSRELAAWRPLLATLLVEVEAARKGKFVCAHQSSCLQDIGELNACRCLRTRMDE